MLKNGLIIFVCLYLSSLYLSAAPKNEVLEKYKKELSQEIPFKFTKKSLMEILEEIKKRSEFTIIIDEKSILEETPKVISEKNNSGSLDKLKLDKRKSKKNNDESSPEENEEINYSLYQFPELTFNYNSITIKDALLWLDDLTYLDFEISEKGIRISTKEALLKPLVLLKIYDFSTVFFIPNDFYTDSIMHFDRDSEEGIALVDRLVETNIFAQSADDMINILKENIKDGNWNLKATEIKANGNMLNVINTPEIHQKIANMIDKVQNISQKQISIDFKFIQTPIDALDKFYENSVKGGFISKEVYKKLILMDLPTVKDAVEMNSSKIACFNGQHVFTFCGQAKNRVIDYAIIDKIPEPRIGTSFIKGFDFQIHPVVSFDSKRINLDLCSNQILNTEFIFHEFKTLEEKESKLGIKMEGELSGSGEAGKSEKKERIGINGQVVSNGELVVQPKSQPKIGEISKMQRSLCKINQSFILDNGGAVILKRSYGKSKEDKSYYLIIQTQIIELND